VKTGKILVSSGPDLNVRFHPGSTAKPFTAIALVDANKSAPRKCSGDLKLATRRLACSHPIVPGPVDLTVALAYSCNQFFAVHANSVSSALLAAVFQRFGLDAQSPGSPEERALLSIGEWGVVTTLADLARAYRRLALLCVSSSHRYQLVWAGLKAAGQYGTARLARPPGTEIAGKTGTSPAPGRTRTHALFAGWAPADAPQIVAAVFVSRGSGGADAAPVARMLFEKYL
jgi:cell division protein FtsI/penicillin-binding protein 2